MKFKSFGKNTAIYSMGTVALRFTMFLLIPMYTRYLTKEEFGLLQTLLFSIQIIITVVDVGMRSALMRFFNKYHETNKINLLIGSSLLLNILAGGILLFISSFISDSLIANFFHTQKIPNLVLLTFTVGIFQTLSLNVLSYYRAKEKGISYVTISVVTSLLLILTTYAFLAFYNLGLIGVLWAQIIVFSIMWLVVLIQIILRHGISIEKKLVYDLLKFGFPLIFVMSGDLIINTFGNYLLGHFHDLEKVAVYSLGYKIASISIMLVIGPFQMAYEPYIFKNIKNRNLKNIIAKVTTYVTLLFIISSLIILFISKQLISIVGTKEYADSYSLIFLILPGIGFLSLNYVGQSLLHIENKTHITGVIVTAVTLISVFILYFAVKIFGIYGLIISINLYLIFTSISVFYFGYKTIPVKLEYLRILILLSIAAVFFVLIYELSFLNNYVYYTAIPVCFILTAIFLLKSNFFYSNEKKEIDIIYSKLKQKVISII